MRIPPVMMREFLRTYALLEVLDNPRSVDALEERPLETWRAYDPRSNTIVVVRRVNPSSSSPHAVRMLEWERKVREGVSHLSLPAVVHHELRGPHPHLVLTHHAGVTLEQLVARSKRAGGHLPLPVLLSIMRDLGSALRARVKHPVHDARRLGELSAKSVRVTWEGRAMHLAWPRTKIAVVEEHDLWARVPWMSPEEAQDLRFPVDDAELLLPPRVRGFAALAEVYTLGKLMYALATHTQPHMPLLGDEDDVEDGDEDGDHGATSEGSRRPRRDTQVMRMPSSGARSSAEREMPLSPVSSAARRYARIARRRVLQQKLPPLHEVRPDLSPRFCALVDRCVSSTPLMRLQPFDLLQEIADLASEVHGSHADSVAAVVSHLFTDEMLVWQEQSEQIQLLEYGGGLGLAHFDGIDIP